MNDPGDDTYKNNYNNGEGSYILTNINDPEATKVAYSDAGDHSAIIISNSGNLILESKWGPWPMFVHTWDNCPTEYFSGGIININQLSFYKPAPNQGAEFSANQTNISIGESIQFTNQSASTFYGFYWTFPGGTPSSSLLPNPVINYNSPGVYNVTLVAANENCSKTETKTQYIHVEDVLSASFTATPNPVIRGHYVIFSNTSTGNATSWEWTFQGGYPSISYSENPPAEGIFYGSNLTPGLYLSTLIISDGTDESTFQLNVNVQENNSPLDADFYSNYQSVSAGSTINFFDQSSGGPDTWAWDFNNDGITDNVAENPYNILFLEPGIYDIKLTITKNLQSNTETKSGYIEVIESGGENIFANFTANTTSTNIGSYVQFTDESFGNPTFWHWTFENGNPGESWLPNPTVQYNEWNSNDVTLLVQNTFGYDEVTFEDYINVFESGFFADFTIEHNGNNTYTCNKSVTIPGFIGSDVNWTVYDPFGNIYIEEDFDELYFSATYEGFHSIKMYVYDVLGNFWATITKYLEICTINHCNNSYQDCDETAIDCGGLECGSCGSSPNCNDCKRNGTETGVDCGGSCEPCQYSCTDVIKYYSNTNPPSLTHASDAIIAGDGWVIVPPNGDVIFRAGNSISLKTGFKAEEGSQFLAQTTPCYCMPICAWIPIVITPNGDEINDELCISVVGAHIYNLTIWNSWGNVIYTGSGSIINNEHTCIWDGSGQNSDGVYYYSLVLTSNCSGEEITYQGSISVYNGFDNKGEDLKVINHYSNDCSIFPNPHPGIFKIQWDDESLSHYSIEVINSMGSLVYERKNVLPGITEIDISTQPKGIYFVRLQAGEKVITEKVVYQ